MSERIINANMTDAEGILSLQKRAYGLEAAKYASYRTQRLTQTIADLQAEFRDHVFLKAVASGVIIGSVRARRSGQICHVGGLVVEPEYQGHGIGKHLMLAIETCFPLVTNFQLFADPRNQRIVTLYERLGYTEASRKKLSENFDFVCLSKKAIAVPTN